MLILTCLCNWRLESITFTLFSLSSDKHPVTPSSTKSFISMDSMRWQIEKEGHHCPLALRADNLRRGRRSQDGGRVCLAHGPIIGRHSFVGSFRVHTCRSANQQITTKCLSTLARGTQRRGMECRKVATLRLADTCSSSPFLDQFTSVLHLGAH